MLPCNAQMLKGTENSVYLCFIAQEPPLSAEFSCRFQVSLLAQFWDTAHNACRSLRQSHGFQNNYWDQANISRPLQSFTIKSTCQTHQKYLPVTVIIFCCHVSASQMHTVSEKHSRLGTHVDRSKPLCVLLAHIYQIFSLLFLTRLYFCSIIWVHVWPNK